MLNPPFRVNRFASAKINRLDLGENYIWVAIGEVGLPYLSLNNAKRFSDLLSGAIDRGESSLMEIGDESIAVSRDADLIIVRLDSASAPWSFSKESATRLSETVRAHRAGGSVK